MVGITEISAVVAAAGVLVGVVYYILDMRNQSRMRQTDLLMRLHTASTTKEMVEAALKFVSTDYKDYDDFVEKYGSLYSEGEVQTAFIMIGQFFEGIGVLMKNRLADINQVNQLFAVEAFWMKMKPLVEGIRKQGSPKNYEWFEYLYNEMRKREQKLQSIS